MKAILTVLGLALLTAALTSCSDVEGQREQYVPRTQEINVNGTRCIVLYALNGGADVSALQCDFP